MARPVKKYIPTKEELIQTTEEVNNVLGLQDDDAISITKKMTEEDISAKIVEVVSGQIFESDFVVREEEGEAEGITFFSEQAAKVFEALEIEITPGEPPTPGEETAEEPPPAPAPKGKGTTTKSATTKETTKPAAKKSTEPRYTRANAFADAVTATGCEKKAVALETLAEAANKAYMKNGGKDNLKESKWYQGTIIPALVALDFAELSESGFKLK